MIVTNVPPSEADAVRDAIGKAGAGIIGNYSYCSFSVVGTGRSLPNSQAHPAIGTRGQLEAIKEERIEVSCNESDAARIVDVIRKNSSYEEPAIFVYPLLEV